MIDRAARALHPILGLLVVCVLGLACDTPEEIPAAPERQPAAATESPRPRKLNLLLIGIDTLRVDHLGGYGYERPTSPHIDALLDQSIVFEDAHSTSSWTLPAFASLMTSTYASTHACWQWISSLDPSFTTLAEVLQDAGHHTASVTSHIFLRSSYGLAQGFEDYDESLILANGKSHLAISSPPVTDRAIAFLDRQANTQERQQPWFLWVHYFDPHHLYNQHPAPNPQFGREEVDRYDGEIAFTDAQVGRLLDHLEATGLADETIVVLVSDHGEEFGDHGGDYHGKTLFREIERVPLAIRVPGLTAKRIPTPVSLVDVMPTLLELLNVFPPPTPMAGRSLHGLMVGEPLDRDGVLLESRLHLRKDVELEAWVTADWKLLVEIPKGAARGPNGERPAGTRTLLFDRKRDPGEMNDVASRHPEVVAKLMQQLDDSLAAARRDSASFASASEQELSEDSIDALRALGYVDEDEPPQETPAAR